MKKYLFYLKIVLLAALFAWAAFKFDHAAARKLLAAADLRWGLVAILANFAAFAFVSLRWMVIIRGFWPDRAVSFLKLYWFNLLAVFYTLFLPTSIAGEAVRIWRLAQLKDKDYAKAAFTAIIDRVAGVTTWFLFFLALPSLLPKNKLLLLLLLLPAALYIFRDRLAYREKKLFDFSRHHPADMAYTAVMSFICQAGYMFAGYAVFRCFNINIDLLPAAGLVAAGSLVSLIPISLLGFGAREGFFIVTLPIYGVLPTQALLVMSAFVFITYTAGIAGGLIELMNTGWNISRLNKPDIGGGKHG